MRPSTNGFYRRPKPRNLAMTLLTNPIMTSAAVAPPSGVLKVGCRTARALIDVLAGLLRTPPWRGDIPGLHPVNCHADRIVPPRIERLCSYETSRFL
jgi:hypothetical protein